MSDKKKVLIFTETFLPGFKGGGPITSISNLGVLLNQDFNILICTKNYDFGERQPYKDVISDCITQYEKHHVVYLSRMNNENIFRVIKEFNPDILYLNSFFSITSQIVMFLNKFIFHKKLLLAPRGELQKNALNIKKTKKAIYLFLYKILRLHQGVYFHSTDSIETNRIKDVFKVDKVFELSNVVKVNACEPLRKNKNELKIIFISRILRNKNLHFALNILSSIEYPIMFDIFGPKEDLAYWNECQRLIDKLPININVRYCGTLKQVEVINQMKDYHLFLFPTVTENFGHVIVEAMQSGLIPIISDQTPWTNLEIQNAGWDIPLSESDQYRQKIIKVYEMDYREYNKLSSSVIKYICNKLDIEKVKEKYINLLLKIISE